mmetsp:Transcript_737/g.2011  ORF Transcript_737/g.2011 Transcript_737/m.2011 type:complete len:218 (+) Transcript_737:1551-2204(+)
MRVPLTWRLARAGQPAATFKKAAFEMAVQPPTSRHRRCVQYVARAMTDASVIWGHLEITTSRKPRACVHRDTTEESRSSRAPESKMRRKFVHLGESQVATWFTPRSSAVRASTPSLSPRWKMVQLRTSSVVRVSREASSCMLHRLSAWHVAATLLCESMGSMRKMCVPISTGKRVSHAPCSAFSLSILFCSRVTHVCVHHAASWRRLAISSTACPHT